MRTLLVRIVALLCVVAGAIAQEGLIEGKVISQDGETLAGITIRVKNSNVYSISNSKGNYKLARVPLGMQTLTFSGVGFAKKSRMLSVKPTNEMIVDTLYATAAQMNEVTVYGASRREQKLTEAPSAVSIVLPEDVARATAHGQLAKSLEHFPGVDVVQSGMNDFNVNTRGFNNSINRRMLVLIDGRDPSTPLLNLVEWNSMQTNMADVKNIEVVRGPGSALYGTNAYNGVVSITTNAPKDVLGTRVSITGGQFNTLRFDARHAAEFGAFSFKVNAGYSQQDQQWVASRDTTDKTTPGLLEYAGLAPDVSRRLSTGLNGQRGIFNIDSIINAHKTAFNYFGTLRADYELNGTDKVVVEGGYSLYGNEYFVNQTGRILIPRVEKPFARVAYNSPNINAQAHYYQRYTPEAQIVLNADATSGEQSNVYVAEAQWNDTFFDGDLKVVAGASHEIQLVNTTFNGYLPLLSPDSLNNNFSGVYAQLDYKLSKQLQLVGAARVDRSTFFETQFSPKAALVFALDEDHTIRATVNRSFLRPSYGDKYRRSPAGAPVNLARIDSIASAVAGVARLGLGSTPVWNLGNPTIGVESAMSYELGYKGIISKSLFVTADFYMNKRSNFISNPLGGLAPEVFTPLRYGNVVADSVLRAELGKINPALFDRLARDNKTGAPAMVVTPTNIGLVTEYGAELGVNYYVTDKLLAAGNFSYLDYTVDENKVPTSKIIANTSPRRYNVSLQYTEPQMFDATVSLRYVDGFKWIAGLVEGYVPAYAVVNFNGNYEIINGLKLGVNVFNVLDRKHYEIFGGTNLFRYSTATLSYQF